MKFYVAGYYLIQGSPKRTGMDKDELLPEKIWSGSAHICPKFPDSWVFGWPSSNGSIEDTQQSEAAREIMKISPQEFSLAQKDFNNLLQENEFGFPNVFMNSEIALRKYYRYFAAVPDLKLLGIGLPETYLEQFSAQYNSKGFEPVRFNGVYLKLSQRETWDGNGLLGYDLLGFDGADYCSFLCGSMESEIHEKYGVQYNECGLISTYEPADKVSWAIAAGDEPAEDGFWAPWLVFEIPTE